MAKFISVLNANLNQSFWKAVQWADTLQDIRNNPFYTAGVNLSLTKNDDDRLLETKQITETATGKTATATIIQVAALSTNAIKLANGTASNALVKRTAQSLK